MQIRIIGPLEAGLGREFLTARISRKIGKAELEFPADMLPDTGLAAWDSQGRCLAVAYLYRESSSRVAVCGFCATAPENRARESYEAVTALMKAMPEYAGSMGAKYLLTTFGNRAINAILERNGYIPGETAHNKIKIVR